MTTVWFRVPRGRGIVWTQEAAESLVGQTCPMVVWGEPGGMGRVVAARLVGAELDVELDLADASPDLVHLLTLKHEPIKGLHGHE